MGVLLNIVLFIIVLGTIVLIHEFGHFYFARKANILCHEFSIGMGPVIYQKRKGEIVYSIRALPLGGYVAMAGEDITEAYIKKGQRIGVILNQKNEISNIVLDNNLKYDFIGEVRNFDLYGEKYSDLFIELAINGEIKKYNVERTAQYQFNDKKIMHIAPFERSYESKTLLQRFLTIFAGPATNFLLAIFLLFIVGFIIGKPTKTATVGSSNISGISANSVVQTVNNVDVTNWQDVLAVVRATGSTVANIKVNNETVEVDLLVYFQGLGFTNTYKNDELVIGQVFGRKKDLEKNDKILGIYVGEKDAKQFVYFEPESWTDLINYLKNVEKANQEFVYLLIERANEQKEVSYSNIKGDTLTKLGERYIDYDFELAGKREFNILYPLYYPFQKIGADTKQMINTIGLLISPNSGVGISDLSGPIGIFSLVEQASKQGFVSILIFTAFLSVNIGFLNLLPIPALDGGRLVFIAYEWIFKKKVSKKFENILINITFILLLGLIIVVSYQDILRLFR